MEKQTKRKQIVALVLEKDGKILAEKRKNTEEIDPGAIIFPHGNVGDGESLKEAIIREMKEELGITLKNPVLFYEKDKGEKHHVHWFSCESYDGEPRALEAADIVWIPIEKQDKFTLDIDREVLAVFLERKKF